MSTYHHACSVSQTTLAVSPARVFAAYDGPASKSRWFGRVAPTSDHALDLRVGGREIIRSGPPDGRGLRMVYTEQGAFLDGHDNPAQPEHGTRALLDNPAAELGWCAA